MSSVPEPGRKRRQPYQALQAWERRAVLRLELLDLYGDDKGFSEALDRFYHTHCPALDRLEPYLVSVEEMASESPAVASYQKALEAFGEKWGLARIDGGIEEVHIWCHQRRRSMSVKPARFGSGRNPIGGHWPSVDTKVRLDLEWDGRWEPRARARERLLDECERQIDLELDRLTSEIEAAGYTFLDTEPERHKHLYWLFLRLAYRKSTKDIAGITGAKDNTISKATKTIADELSIETPRAKRR